MYFVLFLKFLIKENTIEIRNKQPNKRNIDKLSDEKSILANGFWRIEWAKNVINLPKTKLVIKNCIEPKNPIGKKTINRRIKFLKTEDK